MNDNDYIVMIDENGQPYLAHAFGDSVKNFASTMNRKIRNNVGKGSRASKDHKYLMRVDNYFAPGKHLYLYTQDEVNAYMGRNGNKAGSRTLSNRIRDKLGWDERSARDDARANADSSIGAGIRYKAAQDAYNKTALGKLENLGNRVKKTTLGAIRGAKKAGKWLDDHDAGLTETVRYAAKRNKVDDDERKRLHREMVEGGKIGRLANRVGESDTAHRITNAAYNPGQAARNAGASIGNAVKNVGTAVSNTAKTTAGDIKEAGNKARDNISGIVDTYITGESAYAAREQGLQNASMGLDGAIGGVVDSQMLLNKSLAGKAEGAKTNLNTEVVKARERLDKAKEDVWNWCDKVTKFLNKKDAAAVRAEVNAAMGLDGSGAEYIDTHR